MLCQYVSEDTILIGHSLENDLKAMQVFHQKVIDTSIIYPHPAGFPRRSSLKVISRLALYIDRTEERCSTWPGTIWTKPFKMEHTIPLWTPESH